MTAVQDGQGRTLRPITDAEFSKFQSLIFDHAGIFMPPVKKALLTGRLSKRLRHLGMTTFSEYFDLVRQDTSGEELILLMDAVTTNETCFFREPRQFQYLEQVIYPKWREQVRNGTRKKQIRIWSAACSSGEEPFSLSMSLQNNFPVEDGWQIEIIASDLSREILDKAAAGIWPMKRAAEIPEPLLKRFMLKGTGSQEGKMKATAEAAAPIQFQRINLNDDRYPIRGGLDAIFCRNVLIYFNKESRVRVVNRLLGMLGHEGYLFLGHAESISGMNHQVRSLAPAIYTPDDRPRRTAAGQR